MVASVSKEENILQETQNSVKDEKEMNESSKRQTSEKTALIGFILSIIGLCLMCLSFIPVVGFVIFFVSAIVIMVSENMLNKYKSETENPSKNCKIGKILTLIGACLSILFLIISVLLTIL